MSHSRGIKSRKYLKSLDRNFGTIVAYIYGMKTLKTTIPEQYAQIDGKGYNMLEAELQKVYNDYPEYNDPELGGKGFMAMVKLFAEDDFYHEHYVARKYLELNEVFEQGRSAGRIEILEENLKRMQKSC